MLGNLIALLNPSYWCIKLLVNASTGGLPWKSSVERRRREAAAAAAAAAAAG